jgi:hypothetical protein
VAVSGRAVPAAYFLNVAVCGGACLAMVGASVLHKADEGARARTAPRGELGARLTRSRDQPGSARQGLVELSLPEVLSVLIYMESRMRMCIREAG